MVARLPDPEVFAALGDSTRLSLFALLAEGPPRSTTALAAETEITRQGVRKHLDVLADAGLVHGVREGRERLWSADPRPLHAVSAWLEGFRAVWEGRFDRLQAFLEEGE